MSPAQDGTKLQPGWDRLLPGVLFVALFLGFSTATPPISIIQKPSSINITEGSTLIIECRIGGNVSKYWFIHWYKERCDGQVRLKDSSQIEITKDQTGKTSHFSLKRAETQNAGTYVCCSGDIDSPKIPGNGTEVVIREIADLMVNQTPEEINEMEGANVTLECLFQTVGNLSSMYAEWCKNEIPLRNQTGSLAIIVDLERGFTSLTLWRARKSDSGMYRCVVGRTDRNLTGTGKESLVVISEHEKTTEVTGNGGPGQQAEAGAGVGFETGLAVGVAGGVLLFLLLIAALVWRCKRRSKGTPTATSETESVPNDAAEKQHLPLAGLASEVTYADLHFHRRAVQPEPEVVYAEVRPGRKK